MTPTAPPANITNADATTSKTVPCDWRNPGPLQLAGDTETGCISWRRWSPRLDDLPIVVVVGDTADDFAYALAMDRMNRPAVWLPRSLLRNRRYSTVALRVLHRGLARLARHGSGDRLVTLISLSEERSQTLRLRQRLRSNDLFDSFNMTVAKSTEIPPDWPTVLADPVLIGEPLDEPFEGDNALRGIEPRRPSAVRSVRVNSHLRWWVDADMPTHRMPTRALLNEGIVVRSAGWEAQARVSRFGISYASHSLGFVAVGSPDDHQLERPAISQPAASVIFDRLLADSGYRLEESPAGGLHRQCAEIWGSHADLEDDLTDRAKRRLLGAWIETTGEGISLKDDRRYFTTRELARCSRVPISATQEAIDYWLEIGVLRKGTCLWCSNCRFTGWYDADDSGQTFRCHRCRTTQATTSTRFRPRLLGDGTWRYSMNEVVYQALRSHLDLPVRVLQRLRPQRGSFLWVPERTVKSGKEDVQELDVWAIADGRIVIGEVTASAQLERTKAKEVERLGRIARLANDLTADQVVFATAARRWSTRTANSIETFGRQTGIRPTLMTDIRTVRRS